MTTVRVPRRELQTVPGQTIQGEAGGWIPAWPEFVAVLDRTADRLSQPQLEQPQVDEALGELFAALLAQKEQLPDEAWRTIQGRCRQHRLFELLQEDPFTRHAYLKPRGYAGDAVLMDIIYGCEEDWPVPEASPLGQLIFNYTTAELAPKGVLSRRGFVAHLIDRLGNDGRPEILSVAAGHLREANISAAVRRRRVARFLALDSDALSLQEIERCYGRCGVQTVHASIRRLLTNHLNLGRFDLVYTTGLLDYLSQPTGRRLVANLFGMLRPGGRLLIANFLPGIPDVGYMEAFMDWHLIYRTRQDMVDLTMEVAQSDIRDLTMYAEENQNIVFLEMTRS